MNRIAPAGLVPSRHVLAGIAGAVGLLPFLQALPTDQDRISPLLILLPILWLLRGGGAGSGPTKAEGFLAAWFALAALLAVVTSHHAAASLVMIAGWALLFRAAFALADAATERPVFSSQLLLALALGAAVAGVMALIAYAVSAGGTLFPYPHHRLIGYSMAVGACAVTALLLESPPGRQTVLLGMLSVAIWTPGLWSGSRTPLVALAGAFIVWFLRLESARRRRFCAVLIVPLAVSTALALLIPSRGAHLGLLNAVERTTAAGTVSELSSTRIDFWRASARHAFESPLTGLGPDAYRYLTPSLDGLQPHNVLLQWLLDFGLLGTFPLVALTALALHRGWRRETLHTIGPWSAVLTASLLAGMLDGNLYHFLGFCPAALAAAFCLKNRPSPAASRPWPQLAARLGRGLTIAALAVCLAFTALHTVIYFGPIPRGWDAWQVQALRGFPAVTFGLSRRVFDWVTAWSQTQPDDALAASAWAQEHSSTPAWFHVQTAVLLQQRGDRAGTLRELRIAAEKAHWQERIEVEKMIARLEGRAR